MNMTHFNLKNHCHHFAHQFFLDDLTYHDFYKEIESHAQKISLWGSNFIAVESSAPREFLIRVFALWEASKTPVLLSRHETHFSKNKLKEQLYFEEYLEKESHQIQTKKLHEMFIVFFTSGSTGTPKGVLHHFNALKKSADNFNHFFKTQTSDIFHLNLPLNHVGGFMLCLRAFLSGAQITTRPPSISRALPTMKIHYLSLVPTQVEKILSEENIHLKSDIEKMQKMKAILIGGSSLTLALKNKLTAFNITFYETYGMTETASFITLNNEAVGENAFKIDHQSHILIHSPSLFLGYFIHNKLIPPTLIDIDQKIYFQSEDCGEISQSPDGKDLLFLKKRKDKIIKSGGEKISIDYVHEIITQTIPEMSPFHLIGIPDERWGEKLVCFYNNEFQKSTREIKDILLTKLHPHHIPQDFIPLKTSNPYNEIQTGIQKDIKINSNYFYELYLKNIFHHTFLDLGHTTTLIIFHGFMEDSNDWQFCKEIISSQYNLLLIDLPGHGQTQLKNFYSLSDIQNKLAHFIFSFTSNFILFGYSMGGRLALNMAEILRPQKLILLSPGIGLNDENEKENRQKDDRKIFQDLPHGKTSQEALKEALYQFFHKWYQNPIFGNYAQNPHFHHEMMKKSKGNFIEWQNSLSFFSPGVFPTKEFTLKKINSFTFETIYLYGEQDLKYKKVAQEIKNNCPKVKIFEIENEFHNPHKANESKLSKILLKVFF